MTRPSRPPSPADRNRPPIRHRIHRWTGISAGLVLLYLLGTGLPLQFTNGLDLGGRYVSSHLILDWYGLQPPTEGRQSVSAVFIGNHLFWNELLIAELSSFQGVVQTSDLAIVAAGRKLLVFPNNEPTLLESIGLPETILSIGLAADRVVLRTRSGLHSMDTRLLNPLPDDVDPERVAWAQLSPLEPPRLKIYQDYSRHQMLTLERFLQDLHSGRTFGVLGEWIVNLASLAMIILSCTGLWIWWKSR
jgi:hypothetical protein